ncbi:MAG: HAMP domain-containing sensor histidine kinase [Peptoniphilus sp.]|nr:HAMP domain-containing sensor histidine kinase [Peptoniphilus sp.]
MKLFIYLKSLLKKFYKYAFDHELLELLLMNLLLVCGLIAGRRGYHFAFFVFSIVVVHRIRRGDFLESFFTYKLFLKSGENFMFLFFAMFNVLMLITLFVVYYDEFSTFVIIFTFRLIFKGENIRVQNYLLNSFIDDLYNWGETEDLSILYDRDTKRSVERLKSIREDLFNSVREKMDVDLLKTQLITNVSPDLKTPLTSIINYTDFLSKKDVMDDEAKRYIDVLGKNSTRLKSLIIDLIYASKISSMNVSVEKNFIEFNELVLQIYGEVDSGFEERNLEFKYEYDDEEIILYTDGNILSRIVLNLMSNAYKHSKEGTVVHCKASNYEDHIVFEMENTSDKELNLKTEDYYEELVKSDKSRKSPGSGLGIYITKSLIELLKGDFKINIDDDRFIATFVLYKDEN